MKLSITKKIVGTVALIIVTTCVVFGAFFSMVLEKMQIANVENQLEVATYNFKTEYDHVTDELIAQFKKDNGIDVTIFTEDERTHSTIDGAVGTQMDSHIWADIQGGEHYFATDANVNGVPYFGYYIPIMEDGKCVGASFTGIPQAEELEIISTTIKQIVVRVGLWGLLASVLAWVLVRTIVKTIKKVESIVNSLCENDLVTEHKKYQKPSDEIQKLCNKVIEYREQLKGNIGTFVGVAKTLNEISSELNESTEKTATNASEITTAAEEVAKGATAQAKNTEDINTRMFSMTQELDNIKGNTDELQNISTSMDSAKDNAVSTLAELQNVNNIMAKDVEATSNQVNITNDSVKKIKDAIEMIQNVADQTNLLSLNASIESSKAGENGRGFSVVAMEMRNLANQSAEYANNIKNMVSDIEKNYGLIIEIVNNTANNMAVQNEKLSDTQKVFGVLEEDIDGAVHRIESIAGMVKSLVEGVEEVVDTIAELSGISQENSASAQESMAQIEEMGAIITQIDEKSKQVFDSAELLMKEVSIFKVE